MDELTRELQAATWIKSSYSGSNGGNCVEVATLSSGYRGVRDSKNPAGLTLIFASAAWDTFITGVKKGDFS